MDIKLNEGGEFVIKGSDDNELFRVDDNSQDIISLSYEELRNVMSNNALIPGHCYEFKYLSTDNYLCSDMYFIIHIKASSQSELCSHAEIVGIGTKGSQDEPVDYHADIIYNPYEDFDGQFPRDRGDDGYVYVETALGPAYSYPKGNLNVGPTGYESYKYCFKIIRYYLDKKVLTAYANSNGIAPFINIGDILIVPEEDSPETSVEHGSRVFARSSFTGRITYMHDE